jgi:hypothetical protein
LGAGERPTDTKPISRGTHYPYEKGTDVNLIEQPAKSSRIERGILVTLGSLSRFFGRGASSIRFATMTVRGVAGMAAVVVGMLLLAATAFAARPPIFEEASPFKEEILSTRAQMVAVVNSNRLETEWQTAYAENPNGPWTVLHSGREGATGNPLIELEIGNNGPEGFSHFRGIRHLTPNTSYYARFFAKNSEGELTKIVPFKTLPVSAPEIAQWNQGETGVHSPTTFDVGATGPHSVRMEAQIETNGAPTEYHLEYSPFGSSGPWTTCVAGSVSVAEDYADAGGECTGLMPETRYYVRATASNVVGVAEQNTYGSAYTELYEFFTTPSAKPEIQKYGNQNVGIRNVTPISAHLTGGVIPHGSKTLWRFESASSGKGPWTPIPGASGTISQAQAEALPSELDVIRVEANFFNLSPSTTYYVRLFAENGCASGCGEGTNTLGEPISTAASGIVEGFETSGGPSATTFATHTLDGESPRVIGAFDPNSSPTSEEQTIAIEGAPTGGTFTLTFNGQSTAPLPFGAEAQTVELALNNLTSVPSGGSVLVFGQAGGPFTIYFGDESRLPDKLSGTNQPQIEADASGLTPSGSIAIATTLQGGVGYHAAYHFEYEPIEAGVAPFSHATSTASTETGVSAVSNIVAADLPGLEPGVSYRYRTVATNSSPGNPVVDGEEQTLTLPPTPAPTSPETCPDAVLRTGPSANLPDCRGYEQLTPEDKEGAQEAFHYGAGANTEFAFAGEDGEHFVLGADAVNWGSQAGDGHSPYFFTHTPGGWRMTAAGSEPELGVNQITSQVFDPDLAGFAFESGTITGNTVAESKEVQFRAGPPGGPYTVVASVPRQQVSLAGVGGERGGWVGASTDFSKLILQVTDRNLVEPASRTHSGFDLYEYTEGRLRQVNVQSNGERIGTCGAKIVRGDEKARAQNISSAHAVSADGADVFFEAVPGIECAAPSHLYERIGGTQTIDLGAMKFLAAKSDGSELLLERVGSEASHEILLYEADSGATTLLFSTHAGLGHNGIENISDNLTTIYFVSSELLTHDAPAGGGVYRYNIPARTLDFLFQAGGFGETGLEVSPEGRYAYFEAVGVAGVPGGAASQQSYRYDSVERVVQCISCASPFNPEPRLPSPFFARETLPLVNGPLPRQTAVSANGDYAFFNTAAELVPADVDGEVEPVRSEKGRNYSPDTSSSSDVYEWRRDGIDGCVHVQGCLALITNGRGSYLTYFLGSADEGRDVFFYTSSQLVSQDKDNVGDIYDARIGGGTPPPAPAPVECEASACSTPFAAPNDLTPSSATFQGGGNVPTTAAPTATAKAMKPKPKKPKSKKRKTKRKRTARSKQKGKQTSDKRRVGR